ncbi:YrbI family 3-deoxy-D-manno-octulosonate 8-phosphate phosphatase [Elusimicrobium posterum]|uniref:KdsC family phosphatase n=1 Tax=Elusimicrobium posterum TaxID=3116653 RepID=UPI003C7695D3
MNNTERAKKIKLVITDVDGVLTDGYLNFFRAPSEGKPVVIKSFYSIDGVGLMALKSSGLKTGIITGGDIGATSTFSEITGIDYVYHGCFAKKLPLEHLSKISGFSYEEMAFIGDDVIDLPILKRVGLACCVSNSVKEVLDAAHYVTAAEGGKGAVREVSELILKAQGKWDSFMNTVEDGTIGKFYPAAGKCFTYEEVLKDLNK